MRYPNLRYGNPNEFRYYAQGISIKALAKRLRRSERSVKDWLSGEKKVPWWVPEIIRLENLEYEETLRQMNIPVVRKKLGLVHESAEIFQFIGPSPENSPQVVIQEESSHEPMSITG